MKVTYTPAAAKELQARLDFIKGRGRQQAGAAIARAMIEGNARDRLAGVDRNGQPLAPLRSKRTGRNKNASGPPLVPHGMASRVIVDFRAEPQQRGGVLEIIGGWTGISWIGFHLKGTRRLPTRDIAGCSPRTMTTIRRIVADFVSRARAGG